MGVASLFTARRLVARDALDLALFPSAGSQ